MSSTTTTADALLPVSHHDRTLRRNRTVAMVLLIGSELMLFAGLVGGYVVFTESVGEWPPPGQPRLPVWVTGINTAVLLASLGPLAWALRASRRGDRGATRWALGATALLGGAFLLVQGSEWIQLVRYGLTLTSSIFGAFFYVLIGAHGAHVAIALLWLVGLLAAMASNRLQEGDRLPESVRMAAMYWGFVVGLWPALYYLVYLR